MGNDAGGAADAARPAVVLAAVSGDEPASAVLAAVGRARPEAAALWRADADDAAGEPPPGPVYLLDGTTPFGAVVGASPTTYRLEADFVDESGPRSYAAPRPVQSAGAVAAAAQAGAAIRAQPPSEEAAVRLEEAVLGRVVADVSSASEATAEAVVAELVDHCYDAANDPACACDVDVVVGRRHAGYRHRAGDPVVVAAEEALRALGHEPQRVVARTGSVVDGLQAAGRPAVRVGAYGPPDDVLAFALRLIAGPDPQDGPA